MSTGAHISAHQEVLRNYGSTICSFLRNGKAWACICSWARCHWHFDQHMGSSEDKKCSFNCLSCDRMVHCFVVCHDHLQTHDIVYTGVKLPCNGCPVKKLQGLTTNEQFMEHIKREMLNFKGIFTLLLNENENDSNGTRHLEDICNWKYVIGEDLHIINYLVPALYPMYPLCNNCALLPGILTGIQKRAGAVSKVMLEDAFRHYERSERDYERSDWDY